jgi:hypothetical protein
VEKTSYRPNSDPIAPPTTPPITPPIAAFSGHDGMFRTHEGKTENVECSNRSFEVVFFWRLGLTYGFIVVVLYRTLVDVTVNLVCSHKG